MNKVAPTQITLKEKEAKALMERALDLAIAEDFGSEPMDVTTDALVQEHVRASGALYCKEPGVIAGLDIVEMVLDRFDSSISLSCLVAEGEEITSVPTKIAEFEGPAHAILKAERLALNLLQRMSGIATITRTFVKKAGPFGIDILDTRKTTPGLRVFERLAVAAGGGKNHRFGLFDAVLIKDNHVRLAGGVKRAVEMARAAALGKSIEVETTTLDEVGEALEAGADRIMLDNMTPFMVQESVALIGDRAYIEVSGGIRLSNLEQYLIPGVNGISVGALTHSAPSLDISLEVEKFL